MNSATKKHLAIWFSLISTYANGATQEGICLADEHTYFSCTTNNGKILSICGSDSGGEQKDISYKFGNNNKIELSYPTKGTINPNSKFTYNSYFRSMVSYFRLNFSNENYTYNVFRDYDGEISNTPKAGVTVTNPTQRKEITINCKSIAKDELHQLPRYLNCNTESALGCSNPK